MGFWPPEKNNRSSNLNLPELKETKDIFVYSPLILLLLKFIPNKNIYFRH